MPGQFEELRALLDKLAEKEFRDTIRGFLEAEDVTRLPSPLEEIDRGSFLGYLKQRRKLAQYREYLKKYYPKIFSRSKIDKKEKNHVERVPFTNRQDEIDAITPTSSEALAKYFLIHAPSGYGKTDLLKELVKWFRKKKWHNAYIAVSGDMTLVSVTQGLAKKLEVKIGDDDTPSPGIKLSAALISHYRLQHKNKKYQGLVLLIDLDKAPAQDLLGKILDELIPDIYENLFNTQLFKSGQMQFRVVIAGRSLADTKEVKSTNLPLDIRALSPFTYRVIKTTVDKYLSNHTSDERLKLAAHTVFLTGGHPSCMARLLELFRDQPMPADVFFETKHEEIQQIIQAETKHVEEGLPKGSDGFNTALRVLMVYRHVNSFILDILRKRYIEESEFRDTSDFEDKLTESYIFTRNQYILKDDVSRRLMTMYLREYQPDTFVDYCRYARELCEEYLKGQDIQTPPLWILEYLFQWLQEHSAKKIGTQEARKSLRSEFFDNVLPYAMDLYLKRHSNLTKIQCKEDQKALISELGQMRQWEFEFAVNYFLRSESYDNSPYHDFEKRITDLLDKRYMEISA